jgi:hypothetical protein
MGDMMQKMMGGGGAPGGAPGAGGMPDMGGMMQQMMNNPGMMEMA